MKNILTFLFLLFTYTAMTQPENVVNAYYYYKSGELDKAKEAIDKAVEDSKTSTKEKTWRYRGDIYFAILSTQDDRYKNLHENPSQIAFESYKKAEELNPNSPHIKEQKINLSIIQNLLLNYGVSDFNEKKYTSAVTKFQTTIDIARFLGKTDSLAIYNAGLASERSENYADAINYYQQCMDINYQPSNCCAIIVYIYQLQGNQEAEFTQIKECRSRFPSDQSHILAELNLYLKNGEYEKAMKNLVSAIENDPTNHVLYFSLGSVLDNLGKSSEAEMYFLEALNIKPDYFDAQYNLGALYFNKGVDINNKINEQDDNAILESMKNDADELFKKALLSLEKAHELRPDERNTLSSLMQLYARLGETDKYNEIKELLNN